MTSAEVAVVGACAKDGPEGGLQALAALQQGPFSLVHLHGLPAQGGFHAALAGGQAGQDARQVGSLPCCHAGSLRRTVQAWPSAACLVLASMLQQCMLCFHDVRVVYHNARCKAH